ncbi:unnamed protein product [Candidula unifasciata]|uniref:Methyltransferase FkbM domain-containing protein n=1 Tax=Candidula unifasciata TaxID=100452 RepID=A0A8S3YNM8_9EUPU|nr:unnamed protein product [Candidula unifasciata]
MFGRKFLPQSSQRRLKKFIFLMILVTTLFVVMVTAGMYGLSLLDSSMSLVKADIVESKPRIAIPSDGDYRLESPLKSDFSRGQSKIIDDLLGSQKDGFFVELGAGDGETNSVSLFFERERNWGGVLVEANESKHRQAVGKRRKSLMWNFRLRMDEDMTTDTKDDIRLERLFQMINRTSIDLLAINLNGFESELIKQIDLAKYNIRVITVELQNTVSKERYMAITDYLTSRGYTVAHHLINTMLGKKDVVYTKL